MIVIRLYGGLGNQLFQYAAGIALAERHQTLLKVDTSDYQRSPAHNGYELERALELPPPVASGTEVAGLLGWRRHRTLQKLLRYGHRFQLTRLSGNYVAEPHFQYWNGFEKISSNAYLDGFWQSYLYLRSYEHLIRERLRFRHQPGGSSVLEAIHRSASIGIHVRRGDFVTNPKAAQFHGTIDISYYRAAVSEITRRNHDVQCFVFSDDLTWARENVSFDLPTTYIAANRGLDSFLDLHMMSQCRHNVIANSSFSWWAAWLNTNPEKIVVAPNRWFSSKSDVDTSTLRPPEWLYR